MVQDYFVEAIELFSIRNIHICCILCCHNVVEDTENMFIHGEAANTFVKERLNTVKSVSFIQSNSTMVRRGQKIFQRESLS